ncbi:MAG TPA: hypothetical protein DD670_04805 [Planctomycetaceae bacterium]|nr:hypothetical protein [Planctomycetaceae bacterium]
MSAKKRTQKSSGGGVPTVVRWVILVLSGAFFMPLVAAGLLFATTFILWQKVGDDLLASDDYQVAAEDIEISPLPEWIRATDVRGQVFNYLGPMSIMDEDAVERVANAFRLHPWVERVVRVSKHHPSRIRVELEYRRPVCLVQVSNDKFFCVDVRGVWLPDTDFDQDEPSPYPIVVGITSGPVAGVGDCWGDERVVGAAEIAAQFGDPWRELDLDRIIAIGEPRQEYTYDLVTRKGTRVIWGCSPRGTDAQEIPATTKIERLRRYAIAHGSLEGLNGPQKIDVSRPEGLRIVGEPVITYADGNLR